MPTQRESARIRKSLIIGSDARRRADYQLGESVDPCTVRPADLPLPDKEFMDWANNQAGLSPETADMAKLANARYLLQFRSLGTETIENGLRGQAPTLKTRREIFEELRTGKVFPAGGYLIVEWRIKPTGPQSEAAEAACGCGCGCGCGG